MSDTKTYPEMNAEICNLLRIGGESYEMYAADRIEGLERELAAMTKARDTYRDGSFTLISSLDRMTKERDVLMGYLDRICKEAFDDQDTIGAEPYDDYILRKIAEIVKERDGAIKYAESFTPTARSKVVFLMGQGGRCVEVVLEDDSHRQAHVDRFGKVTWTQAAGQETK